MAQEMLARNVTPKIVALLFCLNILVVLVNLIILSHHMHIFFTFFVMRCILRTLNISCSHISLMTSVRAAHKMCVYMSSHFHHPGKEENLSMMMQWNVINHLHCEEGSKMGRSRSVHPEDCLGLLMTWSCTRGSMIVCILFLAWPRHISQNILNLWEGLQSSSSRIIPSPRFDSYTWEALRVYRDHQS